MEIRISAIDLDELVKRSGLSLKTIENLVYIVIVPGWNENAYDEDSMDTLVEQLKALNKG